MSIVSVRVLGGRYRLDTLLGRGGMAAVWAGVDVRLDRPVAVKVLDGGGVADRVLVQRLDREARVVAGLVHPNVVGVYDVGTEDGVPYLVMELVEGENLQQRLMRGPLDTRQAVNIADQICAALEAAHDAGVVHRDIKPDNVLLTGSGTVKVCDFGIAALQQPTQGYLTRSAPVVGTSQYMAPEQATGGAVDARTDLYALGCVLYAMLTGGPPFSGDSPMWVLRQHVHEFPAPIASHNQDLQALIGQLLAKDPADRPSGAGQVRAVLADLPALPTTPISPQREAGPIPPTAVHARAAALTRAMPAAETADHEPVPAAGLRLGPAGIAAVAVGAAAVTALVIAALTATTAPAPRQATAPATSAIGAAPAGATAPTPTAPAAAGLVAVRAAIQAQIRADQLDAHDADDLASSLDDIDRNLARGPPDEAAQKVNDLRERLDELRRDGKVTRIAYVAVIAAIDRLAQSLPATGNGDGHK